MKLPSMNADKLPMTASSSTTPRVSLLLLAFNQEGTVRRAAESVLAQLCEPLEIVLSDDRIDGAIAAIVKAAKTGKIGDGKVFISTIDDSIRIRTEEKGDKAL